MKKPQFSIMMLLSVGLQILRTGWMYILCLTAAGVLAAAAALALVPRYWEAKVVAGPVVPDMRYGLSQGINLASGLSLLGQASGPEGQRFERFLLTLHSRELAGILEAKHHILPVIFYKRWDAGAHDWRHSFSPGRALRRLVGLPSSDAPTVDDLQRYLLENIDVSVAAPQTPNRSITFSFHDRQAAQNVLRWSLEEADRIIRESTESNVDKQIAYLENKLLQNNIASVANKSSLSDVLTEAEKSKILLVGGQPYAAEIINPVSVPDLPTFPKPSTFLILGALIGFLLGCGLTWLKIRYGIFGGVQDRVQSVPA
jgi:hypothetical protein